MYGMILRGLQHYVQAHAGAELWHRIAAQAALSPPEVEILLSYKPQLVAQLLRCAASEMRVSEAQLLESAGYFALCGPGSHRLRRLLGFGGTDFASFLLSLSELQARVAWAFPKQKPPLLHLHLQQPRPDCYQLQVQLVPPVLLHGLGAILRAMAEDYGTAVVIEVMETRGEIQMRLLPQRLRAEPQSAMRDQRIRVSG